MRLTTKNVTVIGRRENMDLDIGGTIAHLRHQHLPSQPQTLGDNQSVS